MTDAAQKLFEEAMKLSPEERERLAQQLLDSTVAANDEDDWDIAERQELVKSIEEGAEDFERGEVEDALLFAKRLASTHP